MGRSRKASRADAIREWTQLVVLLFATGFGVYTFAFKDIWQPARRPTALHLSNGLDEVGVNERYHLVRLRIEAVNPSDRRIYVPALWYSIRGKRLERQDTADFAASVEAVPQFETAARYTRIARSEVVASGRILVDNGSYYDPHDKTTNEAVFAVPTEMFEFLELRVDYLFARDTMGFGPPLWVPQETGEWDVALRIQSEGPKDSLELFDMRKSVHREVERRNGAGHNWSVTTLALWGQRPEHPD